MEITKTEKALNYSDIYLVPNYSEVKSRAEVDISVGFLGRKFASPVIPANMASVINEKIAKWLSENDYFYIFHRFSDTFEFVKKANEENWKTISISVGVKEVDKELLKKISLHNYRIDFITVDTAHGFHVLMRDMIQYIKNCYKISEYECPKIIAGNVWGNQASVEALESWGADALKVGLSHGKSCSTYNQTSFGSPMFTAALEAGKWATVPLIIDGGCRHNGDVVKAIRAVLEYSDQIPMIMIGSMIAACQDAPGENILHGHGTHLPSSPIIKKIYYGSASKVNKEKSKQDIKNIEGFELEIECNGMTIREKYQEIKESLQSACSYAGGHDLHSLSAAKWVMVK